MFFRELNEDILKILQLLYSNSDLCKLLYYKDNDPLNSSKANVPTSAMKDYVYPYLFVPNVTTIATSIICIDINAKPYSNTFKMETITFHIFVHKDLMTIKGGLRPFFIMQKLDEIFNKSSDIGMRLEFGGMVSSIVNESFCGWRISFKTENWNGFK